MFAKQWVFLFIGIFIFSLSACTLSNDWILVTGRDKTSDNGSTLTGTRWKLVAYGEPGSETLIMQGTDVTLQFDDGSQAGGSGGCNTFGAQYEVAEGNVLSITEVISTQMACDKESLMDQERQYFEALQSADSFELSGDTLTIRYGGGQGVLNFSRIPTSIPNSVSL